uniref:kelch domain-containing protein 7A n=1 Tax=Monopterus albus TaxID=43700 RepID=UPI0009B48153|nr:kelch domain-containing protein 7A-like [Monopterus albus]
MPIADLVGVQLDMQLLVKLSFSVATVLLISWAYRFYSSRNAKKTQLCVKDNEEPQNAARQGRKTTLRHRSSPQHNSYDKGRRDSDDLTSDSTKHTPAETHSENLSGMTGTTGRRSPCFLQKLEGSVGVGRELRRDLERQGACTSFLSKTEIKVGDANVMLDETGDQIVHGKIYDVFVESSSHSVIGTNNALGQYERNFDPVEFGSRGSSFTESPSSLSPIIMRDLPQRTDEDLSSPRSIFLRQESYLSAAQQCGLSMPFLTSGASTPMNHSLASTRDESIFADPMISLTTDSKCLNEKERADQDKMLDSAEWESLKSKLDLGNCLETLQLAKKHGQTSVQQAALGVMSDNYLQVLKEPNLYGRLMADEREEIQRQRMRGRRFVVVADMDPQDWAGDTKGQTTETGQRRTSSALYCYDDYKDSWHRLCLIPQEVISKACAMCTMDNYLFVAVGCQGTNREMTPSKQVFSYNPLTSIWKEISPMNEARPRCKLAALDGYIYAIGGECLSSVERYDPRLDRWTFVAPLPNDTFAIAHHVTVCSGDLFVSGGTLKYMLLRYSPKTDTWRQSVLGSRDRTADMVGVGRFLYRFDVNPLLGVSSYRYHTVARLWYECSSIRLLHCPAFQCVAMDDTIYCVSRQFTIRFRADEISPAFRDEDLSVLSAAKGILFPFVFSLPDKKPQQTSV